MTELAVITGASGGIGLELAKVFAAHGHGLVLTARSGDRLREIAADLSRQHGIEARAVPLDLARPGAAQKLWDEVGGVPVGFLVNNAGFATYGPFRETALTEELDEIQLNVAALTALTKLALPGMLEHRFGRILNVASTAAFQPGPLMAVYYATKAYVLSFSEALAEELEGTGVRVTALCPGPTSTGFQSRAGMEGSKLFERAPALDAASVARLGYEGAVRGRRIVIPGLANRLAAQSYRFVPRRLMTRVVRRLQESRSGKQA
jgi:short-subunit dehydrogenase